MVHVADAVGVLCSLIFSSPKSLPSRLWRMTHATNATDATCATATNATVNAYNATIRTVIYSTMLYGRDAAVFSEAAHNR